VLRPLPFRWQVMLDPFLLGASLKGNGFLHSAEFLNQYVVRYTADMIANRLVMILVAAVCLAILYVRFTIADRPGQLEKSPMLNLSTAAERVYYDSDSFQETRGDQFEKRDSRETVMLPTVNRLSEGLRANLKKLIAALGIEFRLLRSERSLIVIMPLALFLSSFELAFWKVTPEVSYSGAYASSTARALSLFLLGITIFYTGEAMHRDRDLKIEPVLWSLPIPNRVLLLAKFLSTVTLTLALTLTAGLIAISLQLFKHETPIEISAYLKVFAVILFPSIVFLAAASLALNVLLREKYLTYTASIAACAGLFYLYGQGYRHWAYNPLLYQLWSYADLTNGTGNQPRILWYRFYWLAIAMLCIVLAHLFYERKAVGKIKH
jgi:ABC-type transport system involved in multi-copper enzyme maturation permease subunit